MIKIKHDGEWIDIGGGNGHVLELDALHRTLTDDELKILEHDDSVIVYENYIYSKAINGTSASSFKMHFVAPSGIDSDGKIYIRRLIVTSEDEVTYAEDVGRLITDDGNSGDYLISDGDGFVWQAPSIHIETDADGVTAAQLEIIKLNPNTILWGDNGSVYVPVKFTSTKICYASYKPGSNSDTYERGLTVDYIEISLSTGYYIIKAYPVTLYPPITVGDAGQYWVSRGSGLGEWRTAYPPTTVGTDGQYWVSDGSGEGKWQTTYAPTIAGQNGQYWASNGSGGVWKTAYPPTTPGTSGQYWTSDGVGEGQWTTAYPPTTVGTSGQVWTSDGVGQGIWAAIPSAITHKTVTLAGTATSVTISCGIDKFVSYTAWLNNKEILLDHSRTISSTAEAHAFSVETALGSGKDITIEYWVAS